MNLKNRSIVAGLFTYPPMGVMLFGAAGTVRWLAGWTYFGFFFGGCVLLTRWLLIHDPDLVEERMRVGKNQKAWDKIFLAMIFVLFIGWYLLMPLDAVRYHWSHVPVWLQGVGVVLTALSLGSPPDVRGRAAPVHRLAALAGLALGRRLRCAVFGGDGGARGVGGAHAGA